MKRLHRSQVAKILDISYATVRNLDGRLLHPVIGPDGAYEYDRDEVIECKRVYRKVRGKRPSRQIKFGEKAARAMLLFEMGESLARVVADLAITPAQARSWYRDYKRSFQDIDDPSTAKTERAAFIKNEGPLLAHLPPKDTTPVPRVTPEVREEEDKREHEARVAKMVEHMKRLGVYSDDEKKQA